VTSNASFTEEEVVCTAGERELLEGFLEYHRHVVSGKLRGLSEQDARRPLVPSLTTPIGLVKHAASVERNMIREHARHIGHADILREQIDGATGD
jgi:hypothetical protein